MRRGEVYFTDLDPVIGSEQGGKRPCVVIQNDIGNKYSPMTIVAPMTERGKKNLPTHVPVSEYDPVSRSSSIITEQVRAINKSRMGDFLGRLSDETMQKVDEALRISLALNKERKEERETMNEIQVFSNKELEISARTIVNDDGSISVNAEDTAIGFGWTQEKNGKTYVRWETFHGYCKEIGFSQNVGKDDYIPESLFYRLGMKASNTKAEKFQNWLAIEVIPQIRQTGGYQKKLSPVEMMRIQLGMIDELKSRVTALENTSTIDHKQQRTLENAVNKTVLSMLGGKGSNAYRAIGRKVFAECNGDLKNYFKVNSRDDIPKLYYEDALKYAKDWKPSANTMMIISNYNT